MTQQQRRVATYLALSILGGFAIAMEVHRHILAAIWPLIDSFWFTYIAF